MCLAVLLTDHKDVVTVNIMVMHWQKKTTKQRKILFVFVPDSKWYWCCFGLV